jgi:uncharacterized protein YraI
VIVILAGTLPTQAQTARPNGYPVTNVNLRAGPGTYYPVIVVVPTHAPISILGCLGDYTWCDVLFQGSRGWMRSIYLQGWYQGNYYALRDYAPRLGFRVVSFDIGRERPFYRGRVLWRRLDKSRRVLRPACALRELDLDPRPICLGAEQCRPVLASLHGRPLGLYRPLRLDVVVARAVRLGHVSLRPLGLL